MPRSTAPSSKPSGSRRSSKSSRARSRPQNRALNALAIASTENPDEPGLPAYRLGKRARRNRDDGDVSGDGDASDSANGGSDSEGNEFRIGEVDSEDDSDIESDDALGESDEERFADFGFFGSSGGGKKAKKAKKAGKGKAAREVDLSEGEGSDRSEDEGEEDDGEEDGEGLINLSDMLDRDTPEPEDEDEDEEKEDGRVKLKSKKRAALSDSEDDGSASSSDSGESDSDMDDASSFTGFDAEDDAADDLADAGALQSRISSLPISDRPSAKRVRLNDPNEKKAPSEYNLSLPDSKKLTLDDIMPTVTDPNIKKSLKLMADDDKGKSKAAGVPGKLSAPLAKRQQDRIDRKVAYDQTKQTLNRWVETVKHNREAEHLHFPLANAPNAPVPAPSKLPTITPTNSTPLTALESTISGILKDSNMASEKEIREFEELKANKLSVEEVQRRTQELRRVRELMYREEVKSKRIKKIKSKSYHRIKKKERLRQEKMLEDAITEGRGGELDPEEEMERERRRAEERMTLRHKQSRWAQGIKESGRAAWDDDARDGAVEMARRGDELRRRIAGKNVDGSDEEESEERDSEDAFDEEGEEERSKILREISKLEAAPNGDAPRSKLMGMKFMQQAEAAKRKENETALQSLREDMEAGEKGSSDESSEDEETGPKGRMVFKPGKGEVKPSRTRQTKPEDQTSNVSANEDSAEENDEKDDEEDEDDVQFINKASVPSTKAKNPFSAPKSSTARSNEDAVSVNPWLPDDTPSTLVKPKSSHALAGKQEVKGNKINQKLSKDRKSALVGTKVTDDDVQLDMNMTLKLAAQSQSDSDEEAERDAPVNLISVRGKDAEKQRELVKRAFAGDNVVNDFAREKKAVEEQEGDQVVDDFMPGWGSWGGAGMNMKKKNTGKFVRKVEGINKDKRKDAKLSKVIINEKRVKKNAIFNASQLPHPFESKAQYERSLRLPIGPEWTTKETFQNATMPRVMVKQGRVVEAISAPFK